jgi:hypothetical protein
MRGNFTFEKGWNLLCCVISSFSGSVKKCSRICRTVYKAKQFMILIYVTIKVDHKQCLC